MEKKDDNTMFDALSFAWELGFLIIVPVGGFLFLGFVADSFFNTKPLFVAVGVAVGICVSGYATYRFLKPFLRDDNHDDDAEKK